MRQRNGDDQDIGLVVSRDRHGLLDRLCREAMRMIMGTHLIWAVTWTSIRNFSYCDVRVVACSTPPMSALISPWWWADVIYSGRRCTAACLNSQDRSRASPTLSCKCAPLRTRHVLFLSLRLNTLNRVLGRSLDGEGSNRVQLGRSSQIMDHTSWSVTHAPSLFLDAALMSSSKVSSSS